MISMIDSMMYEIKCIKKIIFTIESMTMRTNSMKDLEEYVIVKIMNITNIIY
jgi:hypothetical protein